MNVVALLPGSDPLLSKEYLVIGAHLDHVGKQGEKTLFPRRQTIMLPVQHQYWNWLMHL